MSKDRMKMNLKAIIWDKRDLLAEITDLRKQLAQRERPVTTARTFKC